MVVPYDNMNLRQSAEDGEASPDPIGVDMDDLSLEADTDKPSVGIELPDGSITIAFGKVASTGAAEDDDHDENLADKLTESELAAIAEDLLQGIDEDVRSRDEWLRQRGEGLELLGLKVDGPRTDISGSSAPLEGMSNVRHPLLLEAVLRFQANARGELLPADGPVKIRVDDIRDSLSPVQDREDDAEGQQLETDFNHYLTVTATEYYPDTDRMLFMLGFGGTMFKKVYHCPLRRRPVSESVDAKDLIVSYGATDLANAARVTHQIEMRPNVLKRMQIMGAYREVSLGATPYLQPDPVTAKTDEIQGISPSTTSREEERPRILYECYADIDVPGYEHTEGGKATGLPLPFKVTIDKDARTVLEIRRNWAQGDELFERRKVFVKYSFVPGLGFYDIGLLHILGNTTTALTAGWREALDAGMFANFPGFLYAKAAGRQNTNEFRIPPGGGMPIDIGAMPNLASAVMPLPYKEAGPGLINLIENIAENGQRVGGTAEMPVGEGKQDAPVGTTLALIEQATKVMDAVHKRLHQAQAEEFGLLGDLFREDPKSFWRWNKKPAGQWDEDRFVKAINNHDLVPAADPNTSSQMMRIMKAVAVKQLQQANPQLYNAREVDTRVLRTIGWNNPEALFNPPAPPSAPPQPGPLEQSALVTAQARMLDAQTNEKKLALDGAKAERTAQEDAKDRRSKEQIELLRLAGDIAKNPSAEPIVNDVIDEQGRRIAPAPRPAPMRAI